MPDVIMTACCLHNFIIQCREDEEEDQWDEDMEQNDEDEAAAANPEGPVTTTSPLDSLFPNLVKHIPLSELKESLTPKYSGDIRYKPTEVKGKGVSTSPTPNRPSTSAAVQEPDRIKLFSKEEPEPILPPGFGYNPTTTCFIAMVGISR
ncbi:Uncharacterized protein APZ42_011164 [Daphnia magna]|uniref:Uncharacterized protein n=1 Tax=Daphnia magna TaxID=35525 RepID=A0A162T1P4_9CRUS|nr:Uncharacterized protein APZ42_011164 [Daphnia magna]